MALQLLEHFLVLTHDIDRTRDFYQEVLGLNEGFRPDLGFPGYWCYLGEIPVIHIAEWETYTAHSERLGIPVTKKSPITGALDHVAFNGSDYRAMISHLQSLDIPFDRNDAPQAGLVQLFLDDPNGLKIELNYRD